jgi:thioredoxin-related protein
MRAVSLPRLGSGLLLAALASLVAADPATPPAEEAKKPQVEWIPYGEALERAKKEDKHVLIDFYTAWCGWCKVMDSKTYTDPAVVELLKEHFLIAKVNAESARKFPVRDKEMSGRELAEEFGVRQFPMTSFLMPDGQKIANLPGYIPADRFAKVLEFVHARRYKQDAETAPETPAPTKPQ